MTTNIIDLSSHTGTNKVLLKYEPYKLCLMFHLVIDWVLQSEGLLKVSGSDLIVPRLQM